jgi:hypothetical protein
VICPTCGTHNRDGVKFCSACGTGLPDPQPTYQSVYQGQSASQYPGAMQPMAAGSYGAPAGEKRDVVLPIILTFVTCGIYGIYWHYKMMSEIAADLGRTDINPVLEIVLVFVTCGIYAFFLAYKYPKLVTEMQAKRGMQVNDISTVSLILAIFGLIIVSHALLQSELNKVWDATR